MARKCAFDQSRAPDVCCGANRICITVDTSAVDQVLVLKTSEREKEILEQWCVRPCVSCDSGVMPSDAIRCTMCAASSAQQSLQACC